jgi:hypothetical protein
MMVGAGGQLLERSVVDRVVGTPERLVFEGPPVLVPPLAQDRNARRCKVFDGEILDTVAACPPLSILERAELARLRARKSAGSRPILQKPARPSSFDNRSDWCGAQAWIRSAPARLSSGNATACCCRT